MIKQFRKEIMQRSKLRNKFDKSRMSENWKKYKQERSKCLTILKETKTNYFTGPYPGLRLDIPVQRKCWIRLYKRYTVIHLNRLELQTQAYIRSLIQHFLRKLNV